MRAMGIEHGTNYPRSYPLSFRCYRLGVEEIRIPRCPPPYGVLMENSDELVRLTVHRKGIVIKTILLTVLGSILDLNCQPVAYPRAASPISPSST